MNVPFPVRRLAVTAAFALLASLATTGGRAAIVAAPSSIVDHGSYITDTTHGFDWYKFGNLDSTFGLSAEAALGHFAASGWGVASVAQVQALEGQFGWTDDTPGAYSTANYGLTDAMGAYLGYSAIYVLQDGTASETTPALYGITSDLATVGGLAYHPVTASETYEVDDSTIGQYVYGDSVDGYSDWQQAETGGGLYNVWLMRPTRLPGDPAPGAVPEPGTWALMLAGLVAIVAEHRRAVRAARKS